MTKDSDQIPTSDTDDLEDFEPYVAYHEPGSTFYVSPEDADLLSNYSWGYDGSCVMAQIDGKDVYLEEMIMERIAGSPIPEDHRIYHINQRFADCRRSNLLLVKMTPHYSSKLFIPLNYDNRYELSKS
ncbi:hypothetical protein ACE1B6_24010 [Aerosakkonemataceae cyanobacterium BLCC-F154]|uniref:HNH endonuclease n=1 Tax=Floridaenema fluviatile BLCC-F154 TaxID=3153640 RepID=A0ABV4YJR8_9CYAN